MFEHYELIVRELSESRRAYQDAKAWFLKVSIFIRSSGEKSCNSSSLTCTDSILLWAGWRFFLCQWYVTDSQGQGRVSSKIWFKVWFFHFEMTNPEGICFSVPAACAGNILYTREEVTTAIRNGSFTRSFPDGFVKRAVLVELSSVSSEEKQRKIGEISSLPWAW